MIRFEITVAVYNIEYNADHDQLKPKTSVQMQKSWNSNIIAKCKACKNKKK